MSKKIILFLAEFIKAVFREVQIDRPGAVNTEATTNDLFNLFKTPGSSYWVVEKDRILSGGCGIHPTNELPEKGADLVNFTNCHNQEAKVLVEYFGKERYFGSIIRI